MGRKVLFFLSMDTANNLHHLLERLMTSGRDPKDEDGLRSVQRLVEVLQSEHLAAQKENRKVMAENLELVAKVKALEHQVARLKVEGKEIVPEPDEFIEHLGVLFSRKAGGRYLRTPFCPKCHRAMKSVAPSIPYTCPSCKTSSPFMPVEFNDVILRLERS